MEWDKKVQMITLSNDGNQEGFCKFLKENVAEITQDAQAMDMFLTCITITEDEIEQRRDIYSQFVVSDTLKNELPFMVALRYEYLRNMLESK